MGVWHDCIIFDFFYSEYWHYRLVLSFCVKPEVHSFEECVGMRLSDYILCVLIYCNLPDLLHQNGWLYAAVPGFALTVDGYEVNENGAWMSNGQVVTTNVGRTDSSSSSSSSSSSAYTDSSSSYTDSSSSKKSGRETIFGWKMSSAENIPLSFYRSMTILLPSVKEITTFPSTGEEP